MTTDPIPNDIVPRSLHRKTAHRPAWVIALGAIVGLAVIAGLWFAVQALADVVSLKTVGLNYDAMMDYVAGNTAQAALLYVAAYAVLGALILPGSPLLVVVSGLFFGAGIGIPLSLFASMLASIVTYWIVRTAFGRRMAAYPSPLLAKLRKGFRRHGLGYMMFLRLTPGLPFAALNVLPSLIGVSFSTFAIGTFLGLVPSRIALSTAGAGLGQAIQSQNALYSQCLARQPAASSQCPYDLDVGSLLTKEMLVAFVALAFLALIPAIADAALRVWQRIRASSKQ